MNIVLFDTRQRDLLFPFTLTKPVADLRYGIFSVRERWSLLTGQICLSLTDDYLTVKFPSSKDEDNIYINSSWVISSLIDKVKDLDPGNSLWSGDKLIAGRYRGKALSHYDQLVKDIFSSSEDVGPTECFITNPWDLITMNAAAIRSDIDLMQGNRKFQTIPLSNKTISPGNIYIEEGAVVEHCILNASEGPIYIGRNALVMEGSVIRGPFALGEAAVVKMGSKIYGATSIGPYCLAGGEIKNSILSAFSNKAHDGYLGDSILGEWCNLGAGTSASNVKNTGGDIKVWLPALKQYGNAGKKCGLFMGDYSRSAINTSFNSGTVVEICCNIFGAGLTPKHIRSFSWGMLEETFYNFEKAIEDCNNWMQFKKCNITDADKMILKHIFDQR